MAFYNDKEDENQQDPNASGTGQQTSTGSEIITGGPGGTSPNQAAAAPHTAAPDKSGNFVGLKQYLDANKMQSQKLGNQFAGGINQDVSQAAQAIGGLGNQFGEKVKQGEIPDFDQAAQQGKDIVSKAASSGQLSDSDKARFGQVANAQYKGPSALTDAADIYQPAANQVQKANQEANLSSTEEGKQQLLRNINQSPGYTTGAQRFDSYLLNNPNTKAQLEQTRAQAGTLQGQLDAQGQAAAQQATQAKTQSQSIQDAVKQALTGASSDYQNQINQRLADTQKSAEALTGRVNSGGLTGEDLQSMGLENMPTYGIDLKNFYQQGVPTAAGVTSSADKAKYDALSSLGGNLGGLYAGAGQNDFGNYSTATNKDAFLNAVADQKNLYEVTQAKQKANDMVNFLMNGRGNGVTYTGEAAKRLAALQNAGNADDIRAALGSAEQQINSTGRTPYYYAPEKALRDYLDNTLEKARGQRIIGNTPDLPTNNDGSIDWSKINAPKGK